MGTDERGITGGIPRGPLASYWHAECSIRTWFDAPYRVIAHLQATAQQPGSVRAADPEPSSEPAHSIARTLPAGPIPAETPVRNPGGDANGDAPALAGPNFVGFPITLPHDGTIVLQVAPSWAASSIDDMGLDQPFQQMLALDAAHTSTIATVGTFTAGTNLVFSLASSITGLTYLSTGDHAHIRFDGPERWVISWEGARAT